MPTSCSGVALRSPGYLPDLDSIIAKVKETAEPGDIIAVLTNGGFGGIHEKLLTALA